MVWTKLFRFSFEDALKRKKVGLYWRRQAIAPRHEHKVIKLFERLNVPFIYSYRAYKRNFPNPRSPYHRLPKRVAMWEKRHWDRMKKIRAALANMPDRSDKVRHEMINKRRMGGINDLMKKIYPFVIKPTREIVTKAGAASQLASGKRKMISEHVQGVPKLHHNTRRKSKEIIKWEAEHGLYTIESMQKEIQKKRDLAKINKKKRYLQGVGADEEIAAVLKGKLKPEDLIRKVSGQTEVKKEEGEEEKREEKKADKKADKKSKKK